MTTTALLGIKDTRQRLMGEVVEASGDVVQCANCGREIVIHARVVDVEFIQQGGGGYYKKIQGTDRIIGRECCKRIHAERLGRVQC